MKNSEIFPEYNKLRKMADDLASSILAAFVRDGVEFKEDSEDPDCEYQTYDGWFVYRFRTCGVEVAIDIKKHIGNGDYVSNSIYINYSSLDDIDEYIETLLEQTCVEKAARIAFLRFEEEKEKLEAEQWNGKYTND